MVCLYESQQGIQAKLVKAGYINSLPIIVAAPTNPPLPTTTNTHFTHTYTHIGDHRITRQVISAPSSPHVVLQPNRVIAKEDKAGVVVLSLVVARRPFVMVIQLVNHSELL